MKKVLFVLICSAGIAGFGLALISSVKYKKALVCSTIQVSVDYESGLSFVQPQEIEARINYLLGGSIIGKPLETLDVRTLEKEVKKNLYIENADLYFDKQGTLHVQIVQKKPHFRVINNDGVSYYLSESKDKMPLCTNFTANVPLAIGAVETHEDLLGDSIVMAQLFDLISYVKKDTFLNAFIDHVYVTMDGDFQLQTKFGKPIIDFGKADESMNEKMENLKLFYRTMFLKNGLENYNRICLKYQRQVVCEKALPDSITLIKQN